LFLPRFLASFFRCKVKGSHYTARLYKVALKIFYNFFLRKKWLALRVEIFQASLAVARFPASLYEAP